MADHINTAEPEVITVALNVNNISLPLQISLQPTTFTSDLFKDKDNNINKQNVEQQQSTPQDACNNSVVEKIINKPIMVENSYGGGKNHVTFYKNDEREDDDGCPKHQNHSGGVIHDSSYASTNTTTTDSDECSSSSESSSELLNRAPDGGWGWVVVFAAFMVNMIADGVTFSFGVIFVEFEKYFEGGKSKTAWIGSLFMAVPLLSGPIASFLTDRYGCQKVTVIGSIIASTGFVISAFADSLFTLFITFGLISGFGLSLCYVAAVVIVAYYFDKKRSLATGLSVCGSGIGTFLFAPLNQELLSYYGWRGCTLILAGLFLNLCVFGMLMRDLPWTKERAQNEWKRKKDARLQKRRLKSTASYDRHSQHTQLPSSPTSGASSNKDDIEQPHTSNGVLFSLAQGDQSLLRCDNLTNTGNNHPRLCNSLVNLPTFVKNHENVPLEVIESLTQKKQLYSVLIQNYPSLLISSKSFSDSGCINDLVKYIIKFILLSVINFIFYVLWFIYVLIQGSLNNDINCTKGKNILPSHNLHVNQILGIQKLMEDHQVNNSVIAAKCDKIDLVQTNNGTNIILKNCDYDWWIKKDNPQVKRLQTAYLQDIKIHRLVD